MSMAMIGGGVTAAIGVKELLGGGPKASDALTDSRTTQYDEQQMQQLREIFETTDKEVLEQIFGKDQSQQIQEQFTDQQQDTERTTSTTGTEQQVQENTVQRGDAETQDALAQLQQQLGQGTDTSGAMDAAIAKVLESGSPALADIGNNSGTYGSSNQALFQAELANKASRSAAEVGLNQQAQDNQQLLQAIQAGQQGTETSTGTGTTETSQQQQMQELQSLLSNVFGQTDTTSTSEQTREAEESTESTTKDNTDQTTRAISDSWTDVKSESEPFGDGILNSLVSGGNADGISVLGELINAAGGAGGELDMPGGNSGRPRDSGSGGGYAGGGGGGGQGERRLMRSAVMPNTRSVNPPSKPSSPKTPSRTNLTGAQDGTVGGNLFDTIRDATGFGPRKGGGAEVVDLGGNVLSPEGGASFSGSGGGGSKLSKADTELLEQLMDM